MALAGAKKGHECKSISSSVTKVFIHFYFLFKKDSDACLKTLRNSHVFFFFFLFFCVLKDTYYL